MRKIMFALVCLSFVYSQAMQEQPLETWQKNYALFCAAQEENSQKKMLTALSYATAPLFDVVWSRMYANIKEYWQQDASRIFEFVQQQIHEQKHQSYDERFDYFAQFKKTMHHQNLYLHMLATISCPSFDLNVALHDWESFMYRSQEICYIVTEENLRKMKKIALSLYKEFVDNKTL